MSDSTLEAFSTIMQAAMKSIEGSVTRMEEGQREESRKQTDAVNRVADALTKFQESVDDNFVGRGEYESDQKSIEKALDRHDTHFTWLWRGVATVLFTGLVSIVAVLIEKALT